MTTPRRVRRRRQVSPIPGAIVGLLVALAITAFVAVFVGREIEHRTDSSWHYERLTFSMCTLDPYQSGHRVDYFCDFATNPPLPLAIRNFVDASSNGPAPRSERRWVHVVDGKVVGLDGGVPLGLLAFLIIPILILTVLTLSVRGAHRAGRRWRDPRPRTARSGRSRMRVPKPPPGGGATGTPF